jgi:hypothetical protein
MLYGCKPCVNLTRFHGVFAPNSSYRALVTPAKRGKGNKPKAPDELQDPTPEYFGLIDKGNPSHANTSTNRT